MTRAFRLYPREEHFCSFADYGAILDTVEIFRPERVLEFGPGHSTLALIEGGAKHIDSCEDDPAWFTVYRKRLERRFPDIVHLRPYRWQENLRILGVDGERYDFAYIDGPHETTRRPKVIEYALAHCLRVLVPLEEAHGPTGFLRPHVLSMAAAAGRAVALTDTGPLAGTHALIGPPTC